MRHAIFSRGEMGRVTGGGQVAGVLLALSLLAGPAGAGDIYLRAGSGSAPAATLPQMHSYQPYSGLQFGFRPEPPGGHRVQPQEDPGTRIVMPKRVAPLLRYGPPAANDGRFYAYCPQNGPCP